MISPPLSTPRTDFTMRLCGAAEGKPEDIKALVKSTSKLLVSDNPSPLFIQNAWENPLT